MQGIKQRLEVPLNIKSLGDAGEFEGYGSVFGVKDCHDDIVMPGAFKKSLTRWKEKGSWPAMLWQHQRNEPIGVYTDMREDAVGLYVKGRLLIEDDPLARRAWAHMKAGSLTGLSVGYQLRERESDRVKGARLLKEMDVWEVSPVTFPANDEARVSEVRSAFASGETPCALTLKSVLRDAGLSCRQAEAFMAEGYRALSTRDSLTEALNVLKSLKF